MIKKIILKNKVNTILFCILSVIVNFAIYNITHVILTSLHMDISLAESIGQLLACICILIFFYKIFDINDFGLTGKNFFKGLFIGGLMFLDIINITLGTIFSLSDYKVIMPSVYALIILIIEEIFTGLFEEFIFRGIILNTLLKKFGIISAIFISSSLFGLTHLINLFDNPNLINDTMAQVFYATFIGIFFGALYLRTKNIWLVAFYHTMYNSASDIPVIFFKIPKQAADSSLTDALLNILISSIYMFAGLFIARKVKGVKNAADDN